MDHVTKLEAPKPKSWAEFATEEIHNHPYVDSIILGASVAAIAFAGKGKIAGIAEKYFPKAASLLGETAEKETPAFDAANYRWVPNREATVTSKQLDAMAESKLSAVQYSVATHPNVSRETLSKLARTGDTSIRETVASNAKTPSATLDGLAHMGHIGNPINMRIAMNPNASAETLDKLASADGSLLSKGLQKRIAIHPNTTPETLAGLVEGQGKAAIHLRTSEVIDAVVTNPRATTETLKTIVNSRESISGATLKAIVEHPNATPGILSDIASRERYVDQGTWEAIARSTKATPETLDKLATGRAINMDREGITKLLLKNPNTSPETVARLEGKS